MHLVERVYEDRVMLYELVHDVTMQSAISGLGVVIPPLALWTI